MGDELCCSMFSGLCRASAQPPQLQYSLIFRLSFKQTTTGNFFPPSLFLLNWYRNWRAVPYLSYSIPSCCGFIAECRLVAPRARGADGWAVPELQPPFRALASVACQQIRARASARGTSAHQQTLSQKPH